VSQLITPILEQNEAAEASPHLPMHAAPPGSARCFERSTIMPGRSPARLRPKPPTKLTLRQLASPRRSGRLLPRQNLRLPLRDRTADDVRVPARQPVRVRVAAWYGWRRALAAGKRVEPGDVAPRAGAAAPSAPGIWAAVWQRRRASQVRRARLPPPISTFRALPQPRTQRLCRVSTLGLGAA
jgi:hypothetical protein